MSIGGYVEIGLVYDDTNDPTRELEKLLLHFVEQGGNIDNVKYSTDSEGNNYIEKTRNNNNHILHLSKELINYYYGIVLVAGDVLRVGVDKLILTIVKEDDYFGFQMSLVWIDIFKDDKYTEQLDEITENVASSLVNLYKLSHFNYAYCCHEHLIELHPKEFRREIAEDQSYYSLAILSYNNRLEVYQNNFAIDGMTEQQKSHEVVSFDYIGLD